MISSTMPCCAGGIGPRYSRTRHSGWVAEPDDLARAVVGADHRQRRQQDRDRQQKWRRPFEKRLQPEPEIKSDAGMGPGHRQQRELHEDHIRPRDPIGEQGQRIIHRFAVEHKAGNPHHAEMTGEPERNAQAQHELRDLGGRVAKVPALIERPQAERKMRGSGGVKREIDDWNSPPPDVIREPPFHRGV